MKIKRVLAGVISVVMVFATFGFAVTGEEIPDGFSSMEEYYNYLVFGTKETAETPSLSEMRVIGENKNVKMYYNETGADVFIEDKSSGKVYGSEIDKDYIDTEGMSPETKSSLFTVSYADESGDLREASFTSASCDGFSSTTEYSDNSVTVSVSLNDAEISFEITMTLTDDGFEVNIPFDSIKESGKCKLVSLRLLPVLGAAKPAEDGYVFYPDGSGAIMNIADYRKSQPEFYNYSYYCDNKLTFEKYDEEKDLDIKSMTFPVFGIKHSQGALFAEITSGDDTSGLHISVDALYQCYFEMFYRSYNTVTYDFSSKAKGEVNKVSDKLLKGNRTARYHILSPGEDTYSDMAVLYRNELSSRGEIKKQEEKKSIPLSLELFMGISKSGIIGNKMQCLTSYSDAVDIMSDLSKNGIDNVDFLLKGWCAGGYDTLPTVKSPESKLGGTSGFNNMRKKADSLNYKIYLLADLINANSDTGSFNTQKYALRNALNTTITDETGKKYWLNPSIYLPNAAKKIIEAQKYNSAVCFANLGEWLLEDVGKSHMVSRKEMIESIQTVLNSAGSKNGSVAVTGGNKYVCGATDRLYDVPDNDSKYYQTDKSIPFWQMVMHGYADYSSLAINRSYDFTYQKLKAVETGSIPHFVITENSPNLLQGTSYDEIFTSEYSLMKDTIQKVYAEMNERLKDVWNLSMEKHEYLSNNIVKVTYSDGSSVYINYGKEKTVIENTTIPALDYVLVKGA